MSHDIALRHTTRDFLACFREILRRWNLWQLLSFENLDMLASFTIVYSFLNLLNILSQNDFFWLNVPKARQWFLGPAEEHFQYKFPSKPSSSFLFIFFFFLTCEMSQGFQLCPKNGQRGKRKKKGEEERPEKKKMMIIVTADQIEWMTRAFHYQLTSFFLPDRTSKKSPFNCEVKLIRIPYEKFSFWYGKVVIINGTAFIIELLTTPMTIFATPLSLGI